MLLLQYEKLATSVMPRDWCLVVFMLCACHSYKTYCFMTVNSSLLNAVVMLLSKAVKSWAAAVFVDTIPKLNGCPYYIHWCLSVVILAGNVTLCCSMLLSRVSV